MFEFSSIGVPILRLMEVFSGFYLDDWAAWI